MRVQLRLFAAAREAAGRSVDDFEVTEADTVETLLAAVEARYGVEFGAVLRASRVWVNGDEPAGGGAVALREGDEVAVLPPVSGGA